MVTLGIAPVLPRRRVDEPLLCASGAMRTPQVLQYADSVSLSAPQTGHCSKPGSHSALSGAACRAPDLAGESPSSEAPHSLQQVASSTFALSQAGQRLIAEPLKAAELLPTAYE